MIDWLMQLIEDISLFGVASLVVITLFMVIVYQLKRQNLRMEHEIYQLQNEFRAMNSGHLGMGRRISKVVAEMSNVENQPFDLNPSKTSSKTYQQASLLLTRGASIEEVVDSCEISPAEAELLAVICHAAPSHQNLKYAKATAQA